MGFAPRKRPPRPVGAYVRVSSRAQGDAAQRAAIEQELDPQSPTVHFSDLRRHVGIDLIEVYKLDRTLADFAQPPREFTCPYRLPVLFAVARVQAEQQLVSKSRSFVSRKSERRFQHLVAMLIHT